MHAYLIPRAHTPRAGSRVAETYSVPITSLSADEIVAEREALTLQARGSYGASPPPFSAWFEADGALHMPRFYALQRFGPAAVDARVDGTPIDVRFVGELTEVQARATCAVFDAPDYAARCGAMVSLPCGYGKTVWAVHAIARLGRRACVFVHKAFLRDQWAAAFAKFCPEARVGCVQGKKANVEHADVVIVMIMTACKRGVPDADTYGVLVFDECHHVAAPVMNLATRGFRARHVLGLTATKERADGLTPLLHWSLGPEAFAVAREGERVRVSVAVYPAVTSEISNREGKPVVSVMINRIAAHAGRNAFIANRIAVLRRTGRVILVLSDRLVQLTTLRDMCIARGVSEEDVGMFTGATKEGDRPAQLARAVVFCSYGMANEGLDKREADTCIMATPKARVTQCIGRIQRPCAHKMTPLVLDVADDFSVFVHLRWQRQRLYSKERYEVQVVPVRDDADGWFA